MRGRSSRSKCDWRSRLGAGKVASVGTSTCQRCRVRFGTETAPPPVRWVHCLSLKSDVFGRGCNRAVQPRFHPALRPRQRQPRAGAPARVSVVRVVRTRVESDGWLTLRRWTTSRCVQRLQCWSETLRSTTLGLPSAPSSSSSLQVRGDVASLRDEQCEEWSREGRVLG